MRQDSFLEHCDRLPPWQCRLLAIKGRTPLSTKELAAKAGLSRATIKTLARADSWYGFEVSTVIKFCSACGVDLMHQNRPRQKLLRMMKSENGPIHLSTSQRLYWESVFTGEKKWRNSQCS